MGMKARWNSINHAIELRAYYLRLMVAFCVIIRLVPFAHAVYVDQWIAQLKALVLIGRRLALQGKRTSEHRSLNARTVIALDEQLIDGHELEKHHRVASKMHPALAQALCEFGHVLEALLVVMSMESRKVYIVLA